MLELNFLCAVSAPNVCSKSPSIRIASRKNSLTSSANERVCTIRSSLCRRAASIWLRPRLRVNWNRKTNWCWGETRCCWLKKCSSRSLKKRGIAELLFAQLTAQYILIKIKSNNCLWGKVGRFYVPPSPPPPLLPPSDSLKVVFVRLNCYVCSGVAVFAVQKWGDLLLNIGTLNGADGSGKRNFSAHKHNQYRFKWAKTLLRSEREIIR